MAEVRKANVMPSYSSQSDKAQGAPLTPAAAPHSIPQLLSGGALSVVLSFVVGFVDTAVFVHMGGLFVAHVTGNVVLLGAALAGASGTGDHAAIANLQLATFPVFIAAVALAALIAVWLVKRATLALLWLSVATMVASGMLAMSTALPESVIALLMVAAMGVLNAAHRLDASLGPPFTVMTGNVTGLSIALVKATGFAPAVPPMSSSGRLAWLICGFTVGALSGALAVRALGLGAVLIPAALLAICLVGLCFRPRSKSS